MQLHHIVLAVAAALAAAAPAGAQIQLGPKGPFQATTKGDDVPRRPAWDEPRVFRLSITPAAQPQPPLRYSLVPQFHEFQPGNAVPYYYRALLAYQALGGEIRQPMLDQDLHDLWWKQTLDKLPEAEVERYLQRFEAVWENLQTAAYREDVDWGWRLQDLEGAKPLTFSLTEIQESRDLARYLALKARLEIKRGQYEQAAATLKVGYRLAQAVAEPPTLINYLVGRAIASTMHEQLLAWIDTPGSPNLYWAVAELPLIDIRPALRYEMAIPMLVFPFLQDAETSQRSEAGWREVLQQAVQTARELDVDFIPDGLRKQAGQLPSELLAATVVMKAYPAARQALREAGYRDEQLDEMPVGQVLAVAELHAYRENLQQLYKWTLLPHRQARPFHVEAERRRYENESFVPIRINVFLRGLVGARDAAVALEAQTAGILTVETLRMYAASHEGQLPAALSDVEAVPVPEDPMTGESLAYERTEAQRAVLLVPHPRGVPSSQNWRIELQVEQSR